MAVDSVSTRISAQAVRAKHDADQAKPDGRAKQDGKEKQRRREPSSESSESHAVLNERGQSTGKLIDITA